MAFLGKAEGPLCTAKCNGNFSPAMQDDISHNVQKRQTGKSVLMSKGRGEKNKNKKGRKKRREGMDKRKKMTVDFTMLRVLATSWMNNPSARYHKLGTVRVFCEN